jgi:hypothetical protein
VPERKARPAKTVVTLDENPEPSKWKSARAKVEAVNSDSGSECFSDATSRAPQPLHVEKSTALPVYESTGRACVKRPVDWDEIMAGRKHEEAVEQEDAAAATHHDTTTTDDLLDFLDPEVK